MTEQRYQPDLSETQRAILYTIYGSIDPEVMFRKSNKDIVSSFTHDDEAQILFPEHPFPPNRYGNSQHIDAWMHSAVIDNLIAHPPLSGDRYQILKPNLMKQETQRAQKILNERQIAYCKSLGRRIAEGEIK